MPGQEGRDGACRWELQPAVLGTAASRAGMVRAGMVQAGLALPTLAMADRPCDRPAVNTLFLTDQVRV